MQQDMQIINKLGLHARAAAKLVGVCKRFKSQIVVMNGDRQAPGDSIMGLMTLCAPQGTTLTVQAEGEDAEEALGAVAELLANRFDEAE